MDGQQFDRLARALVPGRLPRRGVLPVLGRGALASVGVIALAAALGEAKGDSRVRSQADRNRHHPQFQCKAAGLGCVHNAQKAKKLPRRRLCKACCETFRKVGKTKGICCIPIGGSCSSADQCCFGSCSVGTCQITSIQIPPPTPAPPVCVGDTGFAGLGEACRCNTDCAPSVSGPPVFCSGGVCSSNCVAFGQACGSAMECCPTQTGEPIPCSGGLCRFN